MTVLIRDPDGTIDSPWGKLSVKASGRDPEKEYRCWHSGQHEELTADEVAARTDDVFTHASDPVNLVAEISAEAERRIEAGVLVGSNTIRCDDQSVSRIHGMIKKAERLEAQSKPVNMKFKTGAGVTMVVTSAAEAGAVYDAISDHISFILARSADLQDAVVGMTQEQVADFNPRDEIHWTE